MFQIITLHKSKYFPTIFHNSDFVTKVTHYLLFNMNNQDLKTNLSKKKDLKTKIIIVGVVGGLPLPLPIPKSSEDIVTGKRNRAKN